MAAHTAMSPVSSSIEGTSNWINAVSINIYDISKEFLAMTGENYVSNSIDLHNFLFLNLATMSCMPICSD